MGSRSSIREREREKYKAEDCESRDVFKWYDVFQRGMRKCLQAQVGETRKYNLYNIGIATL